MLSLITDAPAFVVREAFSLVPNTVVEQAYGTAPRWAETLITTPRSDAAALALSTLTRWRFDSWRPLVNPAYSDPTYARAAAALDR